LKTGTPMLISAIEHLEQPDSADGKSSDQR
jgi:hypothetical protein